MKIPRAIQPIIYCLVLFEWISLWFQMNMHVKQVFSKLKMIEYESSDNGS